MRVFRLRNKKFKVLFENGFSLIFPLHVIQYMHISRCVVNEWHKQMTKRHLSRKCVYNIILVWVLILNRCWECVTMTTIEFVTTRKWIANDCNCYADSNGYGRRVGQGCGTRKRKRSDWRKKTHFKPLPVLRDLYGKHVI